MADGDLAASLGWHIPADTDDKRLGAEEIRKALDLLAQHVISGGHPASTVISSGGPLPIAKGGTGGADAAAARTALGITAANTPSAAGNVQSDLFFQAAQIANALSGLLTPDVYNRSITETRRAVWAGISGPIGWASSSRHRKQDFRLPEITVEQLRMIRWTLYRYRAEVAREKREDGYRAPTEIGYTAEALHEAGLWPFVIYEDGKPTGIHYELIGIAALELAQRAFDQIDEIKARLQKGGL